jgi:hypothetical protein
MDRLREEDAAGEEKERQREAAKASRGVMRGGGEGKALVVRWAGGVVRLLVARGRCEGMLIKSTHHEISLAYGGA